MGGFLLNKNSLEEVYPGDVTSDFYFGGGSLGSIVTSDISSYLTGTAKMNLFTDGDAETLWVSPTTETAWFVFNNIDQKFILSQYNENNSVFITLANHNWRDILLIKQTKQVELISILSGDSLFGPSSTMIEVKQPSDTTDYITKIVFKVRGTHTGTSSIPYIGDIKLCYGKLSEIETLDCNNFNMKERFVGIRRVMADGGALNIRTGGKRDISMSLNNVSSTATNNIVNAWETNNKLILIPNIKIDKGSTLEEKYASIYGRYASTSWDRTSYDLIFSGNLTYKFSSNNCAAGYDISMNFKGA